MEKLLFTFEWKSGSLNDNIIKWLKEKNISFRYTDFELEADLYGIGKWFRFEFENLGNDLTGVTIEA